MAFSLNHSDRPMVVFVENGRQRGKQAPALPKEIIAGRRRLSLNSP
jgi:hypothetical protein